MTRVRVLRTLAAAALAVWLSGAKSLSAQTAATLTGSLVDISGGALAGATLSLRQSAIGLTRSVTSGTDGRFVIAGLTAGDYELRAELSGFQTLVQQNLVLTVGETLALPPLVLQVGGVEQVVTVLGRSSVVNTRTSELSFLVGERAVESLPLNGRNYTDLALLQPGVIAYPSRDGGSVVAHGLGMSMNGQDYRSNVYLLDGTLQNDFTNGPAGSAAGTALGVESIQEFRVESNAYGSEFGRNYGGQVNVLTKSGTNTLRGSAYEFHRNDALDAPNYFDVTGQPDFTRNQFGGAFGGPIVADRLFYFVGYEALRESLSTTMRAAACCPMDRSRSTRPSFPTSTPFQWPTGHRSAAGWQPTRSPSIRSSIRISSRLASTTIADPGISSSAATPSTTRPSGCRPTTRSSRGRSSRPISS
jgi:hypothetical protein